jgi:hypothetical protein
MKMFHIPSLAMLGLAKPGRAGREGLSRTRQGWSGLGRAGQGWAGLGRAGQG